MALYIDGVEVLSGIIMHGTWTASGTVTMPAFTLGGDMVINDTIGILTNTAADDYLVITAYDSSGGTRTGMEVIRVANNTATPGKIGFFGVTPVVQQAHIADPTSDTASNNAAIDSILAQLAALGLQAAT